MEHIISKCSEVDRQKQTTLANEKLRYLQSAMD